MPLVTSAALAYAAGLLVGFGDSMEWPLLALAAVIVFGAGTRRDRLALVALGVSGAAIGSGVASRERECIRRLAVASEWTVVLESDAAPGDFVRADHACGARVRLAVAEGTGASGATVRASGRVRRAHESALMVDASIRQIERPPATERWRSRIGVGIDSAFGAHAPLVRALLIADMRELAPAVRERWAAAGLVHMLSVSGLHVGLIAAAVLLLGQVMGVGHGRSTLIAAALCALYVVVIGAPLPAVRAAAMLGALSLSRVVQRPTSSWAVLAVGAGLPLLHPGSVVDLGYQLSVVGMVALISGGALAKRWEWLAVGGWRGTLYRSLVTSTLATMFTAPLVAATFGRVSLVAPLTNLLAVPVMAVLQPMLFLAALLLPLPAAARFVADACFPLLEAVEGLASAGAAVPGSAIPVLADALSLAVACVCVTGLAIACVSRRHAGRLLLAVAAGIAFIAWRPAFPGVSSHTELHMLDVGQGDAFALRTSRGRWVLFDAGREWDGGDAGRRFVVPFIAERGGRLHAFVLSHSDADHAGGGPSVIRALRPEWYYDAGYAGHSRAYRSSLRAARESGTRWRQVRPGDSLVVDEATITFLAPHPARVDSLRGTNDASVVARIRVGDVRVLMTGDAEAGAEAWLLRHYPKELGADVLKVGHHGSRTSTTRGFLSAVRPRLALVSVGAGNIYRHPSRETLRALAAHGAMTLRTDLHGPVTVRTDGRRIEVEFGGERLAVK